ncbi:uncharacterized protein LOC126903878 [Daktulosphaira vitifoliae]|uniref:uncharacterized protein LOC126903878 n=1 Tax=Daktulosphaira vitifoliae TaxID=58002 RepID=UPI0021AA66A6|nr:uncharacterized protein LOC126903878 [Daktulosphaira vitifoliae]
MLAGKHDSFGQWKEISLVNVKNACFSMKSGMFGEKTWKYVVDVFQIPTINCPWPVGHYISKGFDTGSFKDSNLPKQFIYGKYSIQVVLLDKKKKIISCTKISAELKPYS